MQGGTSSKPFRNFTIGRKNWLFSDSPKGAKASAAVYSIIETAKANGLNPFQYLKYLFEHLPNADIQRHPEHLDDVLPWKETIQQNCKRTIQAPLLTQRSFFDMHLSDDEKVSYQSGGFIHRVI